MPTLGVFPKYKLTTPAEIVVDTEHLSYEQWLDYRRKGIGGSDCAAVFGESPFATARDLFYDKTGRKPFIEDEANWIAKEYGHCLEDLVARIFSKKYGLEIFKLPKMFRHPIHKFMLADCDYFAVMPDGKIALIECKTTGHFNKDKWDDDAIPYNYELQVRHYLAVLDIDTAFIACLFGNSENDFVDRRIDRDLDFEREIISEERHFWHTYVLKNMEPPFTEKGDLVLESLKRFYANNKTEDLVLEETMAEVLAEFETTRELKLELDREVKTLEKKLEVLKGRILEPMQYGVSAICETESLRYEIYNKPSFRRSVPKDNIDKLKVHHPHIYDEYVAEKESRRFSIKKKELSA